LTVQSVEDEKMKGQARCAVNIIPKITGEVDRFHRISAELTFRSTGQRNEEKKAGFQGEFSGRGKLSEEGEDEITFLFRGPDTLEEIVQCLDSATGILPDTGTRLLTFFWAIIITRFHISPSRVLTAGELGPGWP
jgi:hypothetical protein